MDRETRLFIRTLRHNGNFVTKPRLRLFRVLQNHASLSVAELITKLDQHDQATVYRNINLFESLDVIERLRLGWNSKLELSDIFSHHHHHLSCLQCGTLVSLDEDPVLEQYLEKIAKANGFQLTKHQLEMSGLCPKCQKSQKT